MTRGNLPPQAYTRDQVTASYQWLQTQPDEIRRQATNADAMVALYLRAKRGGDFQFAEAPVSERAFRENLKSIATDLQNFEPAHKHEQQMLTEMPMNPAVPQVIEPNSVTRPIGNSSGVQQKAALNFGQSQQTRRQNVEIKEVVQSIKTTTATASSNENGQDIDMDAESWGRLTEVKQRLNLSHEREALRMLLILGYERLQKMLS